MDHIQSKGNFAEILGEGSGEDALEGGEHLERKDEEDGTDRRIECVAFFGVGFV